MSWNAGMPGALDMIEVDCPWCEGPAELRGGSVECQACAISTDIAPDEPAVELAAA